MRLPQLAEYLYEHSGFSLRDCEKIASLCVAGLTQALSSTDDGEIIFPGFGRIYVERKRPRKARNTFKNHEVVIPERNRIVVQWSDVLLDKINEGGKIYDIAQTPPPTRREVREAMRKKREERKKCPTSTSPPKSNGA